MVTNPAQLPQVIAHFWRDIWRTPELTSLAAHQTALEMLSMVNIRLPIEADEHIRSTSITAAELRAAMVESQPGRAFGWDGISADFYHGKPVYWK